MSRLALLGIVLASGGLTLSGPNESPWTSPGQGYARAVSKFRQGAFEEALRHMRRSGGMWRHNPETEWYWEFWLLEADMLLEQAEISRARTLLEVGVGHCQRHTSLEIRRRVLLAKLCLRQKSPDPGRAWLELQEAGKMAQTEELAGARAEVDVLRGQLLARQSRFDEAERAFESARESALRADEAFQYAAATNNLGMVQKSRSRCDAAIPYFDQALQLWHKLGTDQVAAATANNLGLCYCDLGNFEKALEYRREAMRLVKPSPRLAEVLGETGRLYLVQDEPRQAIDYFRQALDASRRFNSPTETARWADNLATALSEMGDWDGAEKANEEARSLNPDSRSLAALQLNQAAVASGRGRLEEAARIYQQTIAANAQNPVILWQAHAGLAGVSLAAGDWDRARQSFEAGIRVVEQSQSQLNGPDHKITFLARLIRFYQDYVDALMDRNLPLRALEVADSSRARMLSEGLLRKENLPDRVHTAAELQELVRRSGSTWISYWVAPRRSFLWVVTPGTIRAFILPPEKEIARAVESYRNFIEREMGDPMATQSAAGRWLFSELIDKPQSVVTLGARVVIVPDGPLHQLNFETLPVYEGNPRYWIEDATVAVAPSFGICLHQIPRDAGLTRSLLLIGNPELAAPEYPKLPYADVEITKLHERFPGPTTRILTGREARPDAYVAAQPGRFSMIHIAAHGEANQRSPLDSALILSPGEKGFKLYARDIMEAPVRADLVTISACRSSGARTYAGEGPVGLARAFLQAGAGSVIAGLWDVSDYSTSEIMDRMYGHIVSGSGTAESLRRAKISVLQSKYSRPYYWGPFQLYIRRSANL